MVSFLLAHPGVEWLGRNGNSTFNILKNCRTIFGVTFCTPLAALRVLISSHTHPYLLLSAFVILAFLVALKRFTGTVKEFCSP